MVLFAEIIRPVLRGRDIKRYGYDWAGLYLINSHNGYATESGKIVPAVNIEDYPAIKRWLDSETWNNQYPKITAKERLSKRTDKGRTPYNLRDCAYMDDFDKQKIVYSEIVRSPQFCLIDNDFIPEATAFMMVGKGLDVLIHFMNAFSVAWIFQRFYAGGGLGNDGVRYKKLFIMQLPIPPKFRCRYDLSDAIEKGDYSATITDIDHEILDCYNLSDNEKQYIIDKIKQQYL